MTHIFPHAVHPSAGLGGKPRPNQGHGPDFLEHVRTEESASHEQNASKHTSDGKSSPAVTDVPISQQSAPGCSKASGFASSEAIDEAASATRAGSVPSRVFVSLAAGASLTRVFEQHWFANGYLSFIADADDAAVPNTRSTRDRALGPTLVAQGPDADAPLIAAPAGVVDSNEASWPVVWEEPCGVDGSVPRSVERMVRTLGPLVPAHRPWPERLLRISPRPGGRAALWVRDYALAPQAIGPLVVHLRQVARNAGVSLESVVVNGTTVWKALKGDA